MRPFWPYFGSKWRAAPLYGPPEYRTVIEPFAGSAGYSTYWHPLRAVLIDKDPVVAGVWSYLLAVTPEEVLALPDLEVGEDVQALTGLPQEARWLIGFWLNRGSAVPKRRKTTYSARTERAQLTWGQRARERIASQLPQISLWQVRCSSYETAELLPATWFVDPPYQSTGRFYRHGQVDYGLLGSWTKSLPGQAIVAEAQGADWLPFRPLAAVKSTRGFSKEAIWTNS